MNIKKLLAIGLVLLMIFTLVGCGKNKRKIVEVTLSTEDAEAILAAAGITLPDAEEVVVSGTSIKWFAWYDGFHNYDEAEVVNTGYWTFKEKYGCEIEWVETTWAARFDELANLILGGTAPDFYPADNETFPTYAIKGMFQSVNDYVDYDDPLWEGMRDFVDKYFSLGGYRCIIATDNNFESVVPYNRRVIEEWGFDDPAELYYNDEWTWDVFYEMCLDFTDPDEDRYALDGWAYSSAIMDSCGTQIVSLDLNTNKYVSHVDDPRLERAAELLYNLSKNECIYPLWNNGWATRNGTDNEGAGVKDGLTLFYIRGTWAFTGTVEEISQNWGDVAANELMFVPMPRDPDGDGNYYIQAKAAGYCIINGSENPEGGALFAACERFKVLDPTVVSIDRRQLEEKYLWTEEMLEMYDTCKALAQKGENTLVEYGEGLGAQLYSRSDGLKIIARQSPTNSTTWAQAKEQNAESLQYYIDELNTKVDEFIANGGKSIE